MSLVATVLTLGIIAGLFYLDREPIRYSPPALWLPTLWMAIVSSRPISLWLHLNRDVSVEDRFTEGSPVDASLYALMIALACVELNRRWPRVRQFLQTNVPVILYFTYCLLSTLWSDATPISMKRWVKAIGDVVMVLVILTDANPTLAMRRVLKWGAFVLLPLSLLFIYGIPSMGTTTDPQSHVTYYTGVTTFKNLLGVMCLVYSLGSLWSVLAAYESHDDPYRKRRMIAHGFIVLVGLGLIKRADSMTSFAGLLLAGSVMVLVSTRWGKTHAMAPFLLVGSALGIALFALFGAPVLLQTLGRNSSLTGRTMIWAAVLAQRINPLIGTGFESFWMGDRMLSVWSLSQTGIEESHNGYIEIYVNLGWVGLTLLVTMIVTAYRNSVALFRVSPVDGRLCLALLTGELIFVLTEAGFRMMSPNWFAFLIAAFAVPHMSAAAQEVLPDAAMLGRNPVRRMKILQ